MERIIPHFYSIWNYSEMPTWGIAECNLCGKVTLPGPEERDRYGFFVRVTRCDCDLVFLSERMMPEAYREFYESGAYRRLVSAYHGREINAETIQPEQMAYGDRLAETLRPWWGAGRREVLDVGGSTGMVGRRIILAFADAWLTVLDPAVPELAPNGIASTIEDFDPAGRTWDVVTLCQTVDHLLDPMAALRKIHDLLTPGGLFWVDALDYDRTRTIKIDHPYNFTERTMRAYLDKVGFAVLQTVRDGDHVGFVCRKAA